MRYVIPRSSLTCVLLVALGCATMVDVPSSAAQTLTVAPSGRATTEVTLTAAEKTSTPAKPLVIRIDYGQPHLRGRQLHTGDLVPYDEPWRLGANAATTLTTDVDLVLGGATIPRGTYVLRALPSRAGWKLLVEKNPGPSAMPAATDKPPDVVATVDLKQSTLTAPLESFTMWLIPSTAAGAPHGELRFAWGTTMLSTAWTTK
jgi:hypothetical protein